MNYQQAMQYIHSIMRFGSKLGLERIRELMHRLGDPQNKLKFIHVAGTNGKGSTVTMLSEILTRSGYRVGKYTSPYVFDFRERIVVDGTMIPEEALCQLTERLSIVCAEMEKDGFGAVTEFEFITAMALCYYYESVCDVVVLEVGLGGRFDATNVIGAPLVSVITALSLDHTAILGNTIEEIAFEKGGIIKNGAPVVLYPLQEKGAVDTVAAICKERGCKLVLPSVEGLNVERSDLKGNKFSYKDKSYFQGLLGNYQIYNAITVLETVEVLRTCGLVISERAVKDGILYCRMPARFDKVSDNPLIILDAGHNPQGIDALAALIDQMESKVRIVFAVMADKEYAYAIEQLSKRADSFYAVTMSDFPRALAGDEIARLAKANCIKTESFADAESAVEKALENIGDDCLLICGSFYVMERAQRFLKSKHII